MRNTRGGFWLVVGLFWFAWIMALVGFHSLKVVLHFSERRADDRYRGIERLSEYALDRAVEDLEFHLHGRQRVTFPGALWNGESSWTGVTDESGVIDWLVSGSGRWGEAGVATLAMDGRVAGGVRVPRVRLNHPDGENEVQHFWAYWIEDIELSGNWPLDPSRAQFWKSQLPVLAEAVSMDVDFQEAMAAAEDEIQHVRPVPLEIWISAGVYAVQRAENSIYADVRLRYYFGLQLWNPWQEELPLEVKLRGSARPVWQWVANGLPRVRLHNETLGYSSDWISLDDAANEGWQREQRIAGWVESLSNADAMAAGDIWTVTEPDAQRQPEGLSRLLYRSFPVRPADRITVEFVHPVEGMNIALYAYEGGLAAVDYASNEPLWRIQNIPFDDFVLRWPRADEGRAPFLRGGRSADFRREDTLVHHQLSLDPQKIEEWLFWIDPRRKEIPWSQSLATGSELPFGLDFAWTKQQWISQQAGYAGFSEEYGEELSRLESRWYPYADTKGLYYIVDPVNYQPQDWQMLLPEQGGGLGLGRAGYGFPLGEVQTDAKQAIVLNAITEASWIPYLYRDRGFRLEHTYQWLEYYRQIRSQKSQPITSLHQLSKAGWVQQSIDRLSTEYPQETFADQSQWFLSEDVSWIPHGRLFRIIGYGEKVDVRTGESLGKSVKESWYWLD